MRETWRWFGPPDPITLAEVRQTGAKGIVSALHHVPSGVAWAPTRSRPQGRDRGGGADLGRDREHPGVGGDQDGTGPWQAHVAAWIDSLRAVVEADGPRVICYNFMPVLDWTRTDLRHPVEGGGTAMRFDLTDFAVFDLHLLLSDGAEADYPDDVREMAGERAAALDTVTSEALAANITAGLPGSTESWTLDDVRACLADYAGWVPTTCAQPDHLPEGGRAGRRGAWPAPVLSSRRSALPAPRACRG
jgi:mannonate dehydratase